MTPTQIKVPFVWREPAPRVIVPTRLRFRDLDAVGDAAFVDAIRRSIAQPLDRNDRLLLESIGDEALARQVFSGTDALGFQHRRGWWQVASNAHGDLVGFIQPGIFRGAQRGGLEEGAILNYGVVPEQRGHGYGRDLLHQLTAVLQSVGVWRIFADADEENIPSLKALFAAGYRNAVGDPEFSGVAKWATRIRTVADLPGRSAR